MTGRTAITAGEGKSRSLLPVLTVIFMTAWGLLTLLIVLQDRMIDAQRDLIHVMFKDNLRQAELKSIAGQSGKTTSQKKQGSRRAKSQTTDGNEADEQIATAEPVPGKSAQAPLARVPLSEDALSQAPSSQVKPKSGDKSGRSSRKMRSPFSRPPAEITDPSDKRRVSISI